MDHHRAYAPAAAATAPAVMTDPADPDPPQTRRQSNGELLRRARTGDRAALRQLIERLTPLVWNVARAQGLGAESAADATQQTWITFLQNMHLIRSPESLTGWLATVTRHNARKMRAAERRVELVEPHRLTDEPDPLADIDTDLVNREQHRCLWENLRKLPPACQELLRILAFTGHTSSRTVRDVLDMPPGSIGPTRGRCLAKLRTLLENDPRWSSR